MSQTTEVDGITAPCTAHCDSDVLTTFFDCLCIPLTQNTQPPAEITVTVSAWRTIMRTYREIDLAASAL